MEFDHPERRRNIVVIGGSAGAFSAVRSLVEKLPPDLNAALFFVQHLKPDSRTLIGTLLDSATPLTVCPASNGEPIRLGEMRTACPDRHLVLTPEGMKLTLGPKENHCRPAIDPLFRSAAVYYRSRVIGVLLSGYLSDGVSGLNAIRRCGGLTMVQDPGDAEVADMPLNALDHHEPDFVGSADRLAELIIDVTEQPAPAPLAVPTDIEMEVRMSLGENLSIGIEEKLGELSPYGCPECGGNLWEIDDAILRYRCHVGHGFTADALAQVQREKLDAALWTALRGMRERAQLLRRMEDDMNSRQPSESSYFASSAAELEEQADVLTRFIFSRGSQDNAEPDQSEPEALDLQ